MVTEVLFHGSYVTFDHASSSVYLLRFRLLVRADTRTRARAHTWSGNEGQSPLGLGIDKWQDSCLLTVPVYLQNVCHVWGRHMPSSYLFSYGCSGGPPHTSFYGWSVSLSVRCWLRSLMLALLTGWSLQVL